jgi:DNA-binding NtrC family response regulator
MNTVRSGMASREGMAAIVASANAEFRRSVLQKLESHRWTAEEALGGAEALARVAAGDCRALLLDSWLPDLDVQELVRIVKSQHPHVDVLVMDSARLEPCIAETLAPSQDSRELFRLLQNSVEPRIPDGESTAGVNSFVVRESRPKSVEPLPGMIGTSEAMQRIYRMARLVVRRDTTVLLTGETGTGKELVARAIHQLGPRATRPFVIVNCAAIPETLLESELFGYTRGAFTGAVQSRLGRIHAAHGGTLFLDEVGELPLSMQAKLLRFLQEGEVQRLGSPDVFRVDVRVIAASNADLNGALKNGRFREDLFYRLSVFPIELVPLRERPEDIRPLASHFLESFCQKAGVPAKAISPQAIRILETYSWPGNVRELQHVVERAFILSDDEPMLCPQHFVLQGNLHFSQRNLKFTA